MGDELLLSGKLAIEIRFARNIANLDYTWYRRSNKSDPYVIDLLDTEELFRTKYLPNNGNPIWNESHIFDVNHLASKLRFAMWDKDSSRDDKIGSVEFQTRDLCCGEPHDD